MILNSFIGLNLNMNVIGLMFKNDSIIVCTQNFPYNNISENDLFNEVSLFKKSTGNKRVTYWASAPILIEYKWLEIFHRFETNHVPCNNAPKIKKYSLLSPGANAATERVFSTVNEICASEKSLLSVETLKAI